MKKIAKVDGHSNLIRDLNTNAIINTDSFESNNYDINKKRRLEELNKYENMKKSIDNLNKEIKEIKSLLINITNGS